MENAKAQLTPRQRTCCLKTARRFLGVVITTHALYLEAYFVCRSAERADEEATGFCYSYPLY